MKEKVMSKGEAKLLIVASAAHQLTEYHRWFFFSWRCMFKMQEMFGSHRKFKLCVLLFLAI